jgi:hypothetical protein
MSEASTVKRFASSKQKVDGSHKARTKAAQTRQTAFNHLTDGPTPIDAKRHDANRRNVLTQQNQANALARPWSGYPVDHLFTGNYIRTDDKQDEYMQFLGNLQNKQIAINPKEIYEYGQDKLAAEQFVNELRLGTYLVDPKNPDTQDRAFAIFPELKEYPEEFHAQNLAIQEALRTMIRDGVLRGREDHALVMYLVREDTVIPVNPIWDPEGLLIKDAQMLAAKNMNSYKGLGLFNPTKYGSSGPSPEFETQMYVKALLLKRLYPGLKESSVEDVKRFMKVLGAKTTTTQTVPEHDAIPSSFDKYFRTFNESAPGGTNNSIFHNLMS